jgi:glutathione peroxidase
MKLIPALFLIPTLFVSAATAMAKGTPSKTMTQSKAVPTALNFSMKSLAGQDVHLSKYAGRVVLMVNTASKCGLTPQYKGLQALHKQYAGKGLAVLGFPANNFAGQEPGSNEDIGLFCQKNYGVDFDMFAKISVKGDDIAPLYKHLTAKETNPQFAGDISWNFEKFLIGRNGEIVARFFPKTAPDAPEVIKAIETELARQ